LPADLNVKPVDSKNVAAAIFLLEVDADEMWRFVGNKNNKQWIWTAIDVHTRQVIAFYVGSRDKDAARQLWQKIPDAYKQYAEFYTDRWVLFPKNNTIGLANKAMLSNHIERFNGTLRQRVSRLVRDSLAFSKKLSNHIGAIAYFICHYNLTKNHIALLVLALLPN
jgi:insertion element IS1 protein InsB